MKTSLSLAIVATALSLPLQGSAQITAGARNESLKQEIELAYKRGLAFLKGKQNPTTGQWGEAEPVAFTALAVTSAMLDPTRDPNSKPPQEIQKAYSFLTSNVKPDGGIYVQARANYNTSLALVALMLDPKLENEEMLLRARRFIIGQQNDFDEKGKTDNPFDGGVGYGTPKPGKPAHADMSNTHFALEALHYSKGLLADKGDAAKNEPQLNFSAALEFIQRCQNRPETNDAPWVSKDAADYGGFVYSPGETRGKEVKTADGRTALRSYGSISYAGLLSFIYAGLDASDPRVKAVIDWLSANFTLDENPGLGDEGRYYYYHTMAKGLAIAKVDVLKLKDGTLIDWRKELGNKLLNIQKSDGSWSNEAGRWMESDDVLVTAYTLMALARIHQGL